MLRLEEPDLLLQDGLLFLHNLKTRSERDYFIAGMPRLSNTHYQARRMMNLLLDSSDELRPKSGLDLYDGQGGLKGLSSGIKVVA